MVVSSTVGLFTCCCTNPCGNINITLIYCTVIVGIDYYQKALNVAEGHHRADEGLKRAQKLLKQSKKRDYYKILGVTR